MPSNASEDELIPRAVTGDSHALEALLMLHYERLHARVARRLPASMRGVCSAEDVLQQTLVAACRDLAKFEPRGDDSFYRWLCTIAEFRLLNAINAHRAAKRGGGQAPAGAPGTWTHSPDALLGMLAGGDGTPSRFASRREAAGAIQVALAAIKDEYRQAIELRYLQGRSPAEVGEIMDRTPHAVHNLCHRGLRELEVALGRASRYLTRH